MRLSDVKEHSTPVFEERVQPRPFLRPCLITGSCPVESGNRHLGPAWCP